MLDAFKHSSINIIPGTLQAQHTKQSKHIYRLINIYRYHATGKSWHMKGQGGVKMKYLWNSLGIQIVD